jgi:hypothetical protein
VKRYDHIADVLNRPRLREKMLQRLVAGLQTGRPDECWLWTGARNAGGYGRIKAEYGFDLLAHRLAYALHVGRSPGTAHVLHHCDTPPCCNPAHLYEGDNARNVADRVSRGRSRGGFMVGEVNPAAKLDPDDVARIKARILSGETNVAIAADYPVTHALISRIRLGKCGAAVPPDGFSGE